MALFSYASKKNSTKNSFLELSTVSFDRRGLNNLNRDYQLFYYERQDITNTLQATLLLYIQTTLFKASS